MNKNRRLLMLAGVALALFSSVGCNKLRARDQLNKGVQSYKNSKYEEAINHFQQAVELDPSLLNARMYLATAYAQQYIPGADSPDNYRMASAVDPNDPEPYYSVGVIDWTASYQPRMEARAKLGLKPEENLNPKDREQKKVCAELKQKNTPAIQEGIESLNKAIQLRPDYDDAMAYMNLMYREKADVECDDLAARAEDLKTADHWVDQTLLTKKEKADKAAQASGGGITVDQPK